MIVRATVRCGHCECNQFLSANCRRCKLPLPQPVESVVEIREVVVERVVERIVTLIDPESLSTMETLPSVEAWEMLLIREAMRRGGTCNKAALLIGMGKTTLYRKLARSEVA